MKIVEYPNIKNPLKMGISMRKNMTVKENCMIAMMMPLWMIKRLIFEVVV